MVGSRLTHTARPEPEPLRRPFAGDGVSGGGGRGEGPRLGGWGAGGLGGWGDRYPLAAVGAVCAGGAPTGEPKEPAKSKSGVRISSGQFSYELVLHIHT